MWKAREKLSSSASAVADAGVEHRVKQIDYEIGEDVEHGDQHHQTLDQGEIIVRHALHEQHADAVEVEHLLGDDEAPDEEGEFEPDHGDGRKQRVAQGVTRDHHPSKNTFATRGT